jgi:CBS domain-containing protein
MTSEPQAIGPDMNAFDAAATMQTEDVGVLPVVEGDELVGVLTDRDLVTRVLAARNDPMEVRVGEIQTRNPHTIGPDDRISVARDLMREHRVRRLPVVKAGQLVGMLSLGDIAWQDASAREVGETLQAVSESSRTTGEALMPPRGNPRLETVRRRATS